MVAFILVAPAIAEPPVAATPAAASTPGSAADPLAPAVLALLRSGAPNADDDEALEPTLDGIAALGPGALPGVQAGLKDPSEEVRLVAAKALGKIPGVPMSTFTEALQRENEATRVALIESLAAAGGRAAEPILLERLAQDPDRGVRYTCASGLGTIGGAAASAELIKRTSDDDPEMRIAAIDGLCRMKDKQASARAIALLSDKSESVRSRVLVSCTEALDTSAGHRALIEQALGASFQTSVLARLQLTQLRKKEPKLTDQMRAAAKEARSKDPSSLNAAFVQADLGDVSAVDGLIAAMKSPNFLMRVMAARQLGDLRDRRAVPALIEALGDPQGGAAPMAYDSLRWFADNGDQRASNAMQEYKGERFDKPLPRSADPQ